MITIRELIDDYWKNSKSPEQTLLPGTSGPIPIKFVRALEEFRGLAFETEGDVFPILINSGSGFRGDFAPDYDLELELRPYKDGHIKLVSHSVGLTDEAGKISLRIFMCPAECQLSEHRR